MSRNRIQDAADEWLRARDPAYAPKARDPLDFAGRLLGGVGEGVVVSPVRCRSRAPRPDHVPAGYKKLGEGWLIPSNPQTSADAFVGATIFLRAGGAGALPTERVALLEQIRRRASMKCAEVQQLTKPGQWYRGSLALLLQVESCTPTRHRRSVVQIAERLAEIWRGLGPYAPPLPEIRPPLRMIAGDHLQRITPARRGGGRGPGARVSVERAVCAVAREVAAQERDATARAQVLQLLQRQPGLSLRAVSASGGDHRALRRAVALLQKEGVIEDR